MKIVKDLLEPGEFYAQQTKKNSIYWHHTAGGHRPDYCIDGWEVDKTKLGGQLKVGTPWIIGGMSVSDPADINFDGIAVNTFDDKYWNHHLGVKTVPVAQNELLNRQSIPIEVCNYGYLSKNRSGRFVNYLGKPVPDNMVTELDKPFRGFIYWHRYTDKQLETLGTLTCDIASRHNIDIKLGLQQFIHSGAAAFEVNQAALKGLPGLWSHTNVRPTGKWDMYPCPRLIQLIKNL